MVMITFEQGKEFYMHGYLKDNLEFLVKRKTRGYDNVLLIDGDERIGKSTLAKQIGYYMSKRMNRDFTYENIFFDIDEMQKYAMDNREKIIIWDEAALGGTADSWQEDTQKRLIKLLTTCGKYHHFFIFVIPQFDRLKYYLAVSRSIALIRVYSPNRLDRGYFRAFGKDKKKEVYLDEKEKKETSVIPSFFGNFPDTTGKLIDEEAYEERKDAAIQSIGEQSEKKGKATNLQMSRFKKVLKILIDKEGYTQNEIADHLQCDRQEIGRIIQRQWVI